MCGIAGYIDARRQARREDLRATALRMVKTLVHRGPDDEGVWLDDRVGIALGHRRLSIIDLSPAGHQPMMSATGRFVIVFNGEIYNFQELQRELGGSYSFRGHSDTEVMLACLERWGVEASLGRWNGMFAFAIWDYQERILWLGRDRLGEKPLYYGWLGGTFVFASELKALRAHPAFRADVNRDALALYLRHNCVPAPHSIYRGVYKLLPGHTLCVSADAGEEVKPRPYWSLRQVAERGVKDSFRGTEREAVEQLENLLRDAVKIRMVADVPLGVFLSGGIDSSTIAALMQAQSTLPVRTFSIGLAEKDGNEAKDAAAVARHLGTEHRELYVTAEEAREVIPRLPDIYDEPFSDSSQVPTYALARLARAHVTVALSGDGGDEVFGGYNRHVWGKRLGGAIKWVPRPMRDALAMIVSSVSPHQWDSLYGLCEPFLPANLKQRGPGQKLHKLSGVITSRNAYSAYVGLASHWTEPTAVVPGSREPMTILNSEEGRVELPTLVEQMICLDAVTYLPDDILTKVDRATMAVSLEARVPYLDHRVVEFAWKLPLSMKLRKSKGKAILRGVLHRHVPAELVERPKAGFGIPLDVWLREPLRDWAEALLDERRLRSEGFFNAVPIRRIWEAHLSGHGAWQCHLWDILMFQSWLDRNRQVPAGDVQVAAMVH
jgi:asparagine synthase (glutamine-hydrolysing)